MTPRQQELLGSAIGLTLRFLWQMTTWLAAILIIIEYYS